MNDSVSPAAPQPRNRAGRWLVLSMFVMGLTATGLLRLYWNMHLEPFMPLQKAIETEFPGTAPRVDGGRRRLNRDTPMILRVVIKVPFDPTATEKTPIVVIPPAGVMPSTDPPQLVDAQAEKLRYSEKIRDLAAESVKSPSFDVLEVHFYHLVREQQVLQTSLRWDLKTWSQLPEEIDPSYKVPTSK